MSMRVFGLIVSLASFGIGCSISGEPDSEIQDADTTGTLVFTANGEEFIRDGFTTKDGWNLHFEHFYVHVSGPTAIQIPVAESPAFGISHPGHAQADLPDGTAHQALMGGFVVDLAYGDSPTELGQVQGVAIGNYNYLHFDLVPAPEGTEPEAMVGQSILMVGSATSDATTVTFAISLHQGYHFRNCGPTDNGIVEPEGRGTVELTFHSDHIFGDQSTLGQADSVNPSAIGFEPFAALVSEGTITLNQDAMSEMLDGQTYADLLAILTTIGHTGESHCEIAP